MKVVYGHTDSIYCTVDSVEQAEQSLSILNEHVRELFPNVMGLEEHPVTLEFEKYFESLGVGCVKNRNAGLITWKDGSFLDEKEFTMTGFTAKRVSITKLAKETQLKVLHMWVENKSQAEIVEFLRDKYNEVLSGHININDILKRSRYREERFNVKCSNCKRRNSYGSLIEHGACCNQMNIQTVEGKRPTIGAGIEGIIFYNSKNVHKIDDSYLYCRITGCNETYFHPIKQEAVVPNYVSGLTEEDFSDYTPDWRHYAESVVKKAEPIFMAMDWDIKQITRDVNERSLLEWF